MKIRPLYDRIIVDRKDAETTTASGIIIPDSAKEKPMEGTIIAAGKGRLKQDGIIPLDVKVGDTVLFSAYAGSDVKIDGKTYLMMKEDDVLGVIED